MDWTATNFWIQVGTGFLGAHAAAAVVQKLYLGFVRTSLAGLVAGGLSGLALADAGDYDGE